jgi:acetoin utilization protein AcuC
MHDAAAAVAGGSIRAMEAILRGDVEHAFHPGGGLHHAMRDHASGFCIYDDVALAIARAARRAARAVLDFDVHHGDGVQAIHWNDPGS